jgi:prolyl-tRNA synthetase
MRWTQTLIPTQKETPADAQIISHQLMIRAGLIRQLTAGAYDFLPLGYRSLRKAAQIVREEMDAIGAAEVSLPALQPAELWQKTGRDISYGENLMKFKDRHGRLNVLGPTHEEVVTELVSAFVNSYKNLPLSLYQIQTKFRDEFRPRFGLLRVREFLMKDAYSFHANLQSLNATYDDFYKAYEKIFTRCGIPYVVVEAESGPIGGSASHEFMANCDAGEDTILTSDKGNYSANVEKAEIGDRPENMAGAPTGDLEEVHTPGMSSIEDVGKYLKVKPKHFLKTLVFKVRGAIKRSPGVMVISSTEHATALVFVVLRGDHEANETKVRRLLSNYFSETSTVEMIDAEDAKRWGIPIGFIGPDFGIRFAAEAAPEGIDRAAKSNWLNSRPVPLWLVDFDAAQGGFWATGANKVDFHNKHFNWERDFVAISKANGMRGDVLIADIRNAIAGDPSPKNDGGKLQSSKGIEIGHVFKLGTKYSDALGANFLDDKGQQNPMIMGCYGIGIGRILIAAIESLHDDKGIIWPTAIAPYSVVITPIKYDGEVKEAADKIYAQLNSAGIDTLLDDRDARPGSKFADADLIGFPIRITIGDRGLKEGKVELKKRTAADPEMVGIDQVLGRVQESL